MGVQKSLQENDAEKRGFNDYFFVKKFDLDPSREDRGWSLTIFFSIYFQKKINDFGILANSPKNVIFSDLLAVLDPPRGCPRTTFGVIVGTFWGNFGFDSGYLQDLQTKQKQLLFLFVTVKRNSKNMCVCVERVLNAVNQMNQNKKNSVPFYV